MVNMLISLQREKAVVQRSLKIEDRIPGLGLIGVQKFGKPRVRSLGDRSVEWNKAFVFSRSAIAGWDEVIGSSVHRDIGSSGMAWDRRRQVL